MIVTDIVELSKSRVKIYIDNEIAFALYKGELGKLKVYKEKEITQAHYDFIINEVLLKRAKLRCMNLLKSKDYTRHQLITKLKQNIYPISVIERAIEYVESYGYIDDNRYANSYIACNSKIKSRKQIELNLMQKGIDKAIIEEEFLRLIDSDEVENEENLILRLLEKKRFNKENSTYDEIQKIIAYLYRKGFSLDKIYKVIDSIE